MIIKIFDLSINFFFLVQQVRQCLDNTIAEMTTNLEKHKEIRDKRQCIQSLIRFKKSLEKLTCILGSCNVLSVDLKPDVLERAATEFNQLNFHSNRCTSDLSQEQIKVSERLNDFFLVKIKLLLIIDFVLFFN